MLDELISELIPRGADIVKVIDISILKPTENLGYSVAILIGIVLGPKYIYRLSKEDILDYSEYSDKENNVDKLAEWTADFISAKSYKAFAQSERNLSLYGFYDETTKTTPLPTVNRPIIIPKCEKCTVCKDICPAGVLHSASWSIGINRDSIVDVYHCEGCLKCLTNCPWTQKYMRDNLKRTIREGII